MLTFHDGAATPPLTDLATLPATVTWIDLLAGSPDELAVVERLLGKHIPTFAELTEIENSSRVRVDRGALYLSTPVIARDAAHLPFISPVGFIVTAHYLVTIRFAELSVFKAFTALYAAADTPHSGLDAFIGLTGALIDHAADRLEAVGADLDQLSHIVFVRETAQAAAPISSARQAQNLQQALRRIGSCGDLSSRIRDSMLGLARIVSFAATAHCPGLALTEGQRVQLDSHRHDIASLVDYNGYTTSKVQLLLDATIGLIGIEQNNIIKVMTVVSVVGVPPTLVASIYGMNFKNMPELDWHYGYAYALVLIVLTAILPLAWFKRRGWL